jgi:hypothetical protein
MLWLAAVVVVAAGAAAVAAVVAACREAAECLAEAECRGAAVDTVVVADIEAAGLAALLRCHARREVRHR